MKTVLITGANRGIGWETARVLASSGYRVYLGTRESGRTGQSVEDLEGEAIWLTIDVADSGSVRNAASWLADAEASLDILINNAGIYPDDGITILDVSREQMVETFQTNTFGVVEVTQAFLPMLRKAGEGRVIHVSSGYGQLESLQPTVPSYCLSKLALNGVTIMQAKQLQPEGIAVNCLSPGWVRTDMGGSEADRSVEEGAAGVVWLAHEAPQSLTGKFLRDGEEIDW